MIPGKGTAKMKEIVSLEGQREKGNKKCTFEVAIKFQKNATWQGQINWLETKQIQEFRSMLEMIKLMDGALATIKEEEEEVSWANTG